MYSLVKSCVNDESKPIYISHEHFILNSSHDMDLRASWLASTNRYGEDYDPEAEFKFVLPNILKLFPNTKILLILRNQIDLMKSEFSHRLREGVKGWSTVSSWDSFVEVSHKNKYYDRFIKELHLLFGIENVFVSSVEMLFSEKSEFQDFLKFCCISQLDVDFKNSRENSGSYLLKEIYYRKFIWTKNKIKDTPFFINQKISDFIYYSVLRRKIVDDFVALFYKLKYGSKSLDLVIGKELSYEFKKSNKEAENLIGKMLF